VNPRSRQSILHLQMGQEVIYLLLTVAMVAALVLLLRMAGESRQQDAAPPLPMPAPPEPATRSGAPLPSPDLPPIIRLSEARGYYFPLGSAEITPGLRLRLAGEVVPRILDLGRRYQVDVIEVVGHTDEIPLRLESHSNLDFQLLAYLSGTGDAGDLHAADNVGLGMARAAAVARELLRNPELAAYTILPFSGGQAIATDQTLAAGHAATDEQERRRSEIRMRRRQ
jgi:outer membrane protein OmpA-like peptidoglycan-associated protein